MLEKVLYCSRHAGACLENEALEGEEEARGAVPGASGNGLAVPEHSWRCCVDRVYRDRTLGKGFNTVYNSSFIFPLSIVL